MRRIGLSQQSLSRQRLMGALDDRVIGGTALACKAYLDAKSNQPYMQPGGKRRRSLVIVEDGAMIQGEGLGQTIRQERPAQRQLLVRQSRIGRVEAGITFGASGDW